MTIIEYGRETPDVLETVELSWTIAQNLDISRGAGELQIDGALFFDFIAGNFEANAEVCRELRRFSLDIRAAGEDLGIFLSAYNANQNSLAGLLPFPGYTNLSQGVGLFTTRFHKRIELILPTSRLKNDLNSNPVTNALGFARANEPCF
ncbi:MAG: hypothetical protein AAF598_19500 [Bacteroidota bacterium]